VAQWNVTYQRQLAGNWMASVSYLGNKTTHLWIAGEVNPAIYGPGATVGNTNQRRLLYLANPTLGAAYASIDTMDDGAVAHYQGLMLSVQHRFANNFTFLANYTDSYCESDYDFGAALAGSTNSQLFNRSADRGPCIFDTRHNFNASLVATSSVKLGNPWVNRLLSNWQFAPLVHASSGQPLNVTTGKDNSLTGLGTDRPVQLMSDVYAPTHTCTGAPCLQWINPAAFQPNALGTYGNVGRNELRGPATVNFDAAISRIFRLNERFSLQARADAFNVFNHTNFVGAISPAGLPTSYSTLSTNLSSSNFGQVQAAFDPRILQFSMKLHF